MKSSFAAVGFAAILIAGGARAQGFTRGWDTPTPLTDTDRAIIRSTVERQIHGKPVGTVVNWRNPAGGHSGTITLLGKSTRQGMPCERIRYQLMEPGSAQQRRQQHGLYVFNSCRLPDGSWKLAD